MPAIRVRYLWPRHVKTLQQILVLRQFRKAKGSVLLGRMKLGTAPGYVLVHPEFLKHLGPKALTWLADLFTRMIWEQWIPKIRGREVKIIAVAKPDKDPQQQLTICFKSSKPIQIGLCMLMSLSIHLHGLHLDTQYGQTWHLSTQSHSGERTGCRLLWSTILLLPTLLSNSQVSISLVIHGFWLTVSKQVKAHVMLTCKNGVSPYYLLVIVANDRPWTTLWTRAH